MKKNTPSAQEAAPSVAPAPFEIVGLQPADHLPILFGGQTYDLARLTPEQADYLLQHPDQVPYLKKLDVSPAND